MINEVTQGNALKTWWDNAEFKGKEFCQLKENGDLVLQKTATHPERTIVTLTPENAEAALKALIEKFPEVESRVNELKQEWETTEDKLKLMGKVSRLRDYLAHTNAVGDFDVLLLQVGEWEMVITDLTEANHGKKLELVEKAEKIAGENTHWKETTQIFKDITEQWKHIGFVDKNRNDDLWNRLETAKNKFFDRKREFQESQEREMLANLDLKMELVEKAEALADSDDWKEATELFRKLMDEWRTVGRTVYEKNEELWNRFIKAKNNFFEKKRVHFENIRAEQESNYPIKLALVERAEALRDSTDWNKTSHLFADIMTEWKKAGRVPLDKAEELWERLNASKDHFFSNKRQHLEAARVTQEDNYARKLSLVKRAEELKNSNNWREATEELNELLTEWKKIGPVPKEHLSDLWEQFISARRFFFDRKDADRERRRQHAEKQFENKFSKTKTFLSQLENELKEEQERLADFRIALENVTPGNKEEELRAHLHKLISQSEVKVRHKEEMVQGIHQQLEEIETKKVKAEHPATEEIKQTEDPLAKKKKQEKKKDPEPPEDKETEAPDETGNS